MPKMPLPTWIEKLPQGNARDIAINRFYLRLAALYASESGGVKGLSVVLRINYGTLRAQSLSRVRASRRTKARIKRVLGEAFVPPDLPELHRPRR